MAPPEIPAKAPLQTPKKDLIDHLREELLRRCEKRRSYSLRAFAKALKVHPATLSHILNRKRKLSPAIRSHLMSQLGLSPEDVMRLSSGTSTHESLETQTYTELNLDTFRTISDWYHFAILELLRLKHFKPDIKWVAHTLGISFVEAKEAVRRLERLKILEITENRWVNRSGDHTNRQPDNFSDIALRKFQKQILEKALLALEDIPLGQRDQSSMTFAMDSRKMKTAIKEIQQFRRQLCQRLENSGPYDHVYHLSISLYPVTRLADAQSLKESS